MVRVFTFSIQLCPVSFEFFLQLNRPKNKFSREFVLTIKPRWWPYKAEQRVKQCLEGELTKYRHGITGYTYEGQRCHMANSRVAAQPSSSSEFVLLGLETHIIAPLLLGLIIAPRA